MSTKEVNDAVRLCIEGLLGKTALFRDDLLAKLMDLAAADAGKYRAAVDGLGMCHLNGCVSITCPSRTCYLCAQAKQPFYHADISLVAVVCTGPKLL